MSNTSNTYVYKLSLVNNTSDGVIYEYQSKCACTSLEKLFEMLCKIQKMNTYICIGESNHSESEDEEYLFLSGNVIQNSWIVYKYMLYIINMNTKHVIIHFV